MTRAVRHMVDPDQMVHLKSIAFIHYKYRIRAFSFKFLPTLSIFCLRRNRRTLSGSPVSRNRLEADRNPVNWGQSLWAKGIPNSQRGKIDWSMCGCVGLKAVSANIFLPIFVHVNPWKSIFPDSSLFMLFGVPSGLPRKILQFFFVFFVWQAANRDHNDTPLYFYDFPMPHTGSLHMEHNLWSIRSMVKNFWQIHFEQILILFLYGLYIYI